MDNKELQRAVNPVYLTAKGTLGLLKRAEDPDAVALLPLIGLDADLQEKAKVLPAPIAHLPGRTGAYGRNGSSPLSKGEGTLFHTLQYGILPQ